MQVPVPFNQTEKYWSRVRRTMLAHIIMILPLPAITAIQHFSSQISSLASSEAMISKSKNESHINIYPNPVKSILTITGLVPNTSLAIVNSNGEKLTAITTSFNTYNWNIQNLPAGNYFLVATQNNKIISSRKFIKQ